MSDAQLLVQAKDVLREAGIDNPVREARQLWDAASSKTSGDIAEAFQELVQRRAAREPMSHLLGYREFYKHRFEVGPEALDPRPDTETLVETALEHPFERLLDLGTGTGCILLSLLAERPNAQGVGADLSPAALTLAGRNCANLGLENRTTLIVSDWFTEITGQFDLIVSNPPYITIAEMSQLGPELAYEPRLALTDEGDGLACYRIITAQAPDYLVAGGWLMVEIGPSQGAAVSALFNTVGLQNVAVRTDFDGRDRVIVGQKPL